MKVNTFNWTNWYWIIDSVAKCASNVSCAIALRGSVTFLFAFCSTHLWTHVCDLTYCSNKDNNLSLFIQFYLSKWTAAKEIFSIWYDSAANQRDICFSCANNNDGDTIWIWFIEFVCNVSHCMVYGIIISNNIERRIVHMLFTIRKDR